MERIPLRSLSWSAVLLALLAGAALARPVVNGAAIETRTFNDCPISTLSTSNHYPASIEISDAMSPLCVGFANLHSWTFSEDGGTTPAVFNNVSNFHFGADLVISGAGQGEGGLRISPWYGKFVDGRFMLNVTSGEIACFGGTLPFYSFTVNHGVTYTRGTTAHMEITYQAHDLTSVNPATIQYRLGYNGNTYDSPVLPFGEQNPNECNSPQYNDLFGMMNDGRVGGYFQPRANSGASLTATWSNITFEKCQVQVAASFHPSTLNLNSNGKWVTVTLEPTPPTTPADLELSSILLNGSVGIDPGAPVSIGDDNGNGIPDLTVKFKRSDVAALFGPGDYTTTVTVSGAVGKGCFEASASVHIKHASLPHPTPNSMVTPGTQVDLVWEPLNGVHTVSVTLSLDNGTTWTVDADAIANSGSYRWTVPNVSSIQARVAVVQLRNGGPDAEAEITASGPFTISSTTGVGEGVASFALGRIAPNPAGNRFDVSFSLPSGAPATLAVFDVSGRRVATQEVGGLGAGIHVVRFGEREVLRAGLYVVRLSQQSRKLTTSVLILP